MRSVKGVVLDGIIKLVSINKHKWMMIQELNLSSVSFNVYQGSENFTYM